MNKSYFAGATTPEGFVSYFDNLFDEKNRVYILKGGPGTGKSTLMKRAAQFLDERNEEYELFYCSSDPDSLDAIKVMKNGAVILDGTAPHTVDPKYPGVSEIIVNLGENFDREKLRENGEKIVSLFDENAKIHKQVRRYLSASGTLCEDTHSVGLLISKLPLVNEYAQLLAERLIPKGRGDAKETKRFLSAVTPKGITTLNGLEGLDKVLVIEDRIGAVSGLMVAYFKSAALKSGFDVISLMSPFVSGKTEHVVIPSLSLAVCTSSTVKISPKGEKIIRASRFYDEEKLNRFKQRIIFNHRASRRLIKNASQLLVTANEVHRELESYYVGAMNFDKINATTEKIIAEILQ